MKWKFWQRGAMSNPWMSISSTTVDEVVRTLSSKYGKLYCINIGAGGQDDPNFQTLDIDTANEPDYVCDIRVLFAASDYYRGKINQYPDAVKLSPNQFMLVWEQHTAEHMEWIYQQCHFQWLYNITAPGGCLVVEVPNLEFITKVYLRNLERQRKGKKVMFPASDHPDMSVEEIADMQRWTNFKIFSGCSPGDYHYTCFDTMLLWWAMSLAGFEKISIWNGSSLKAVCYKPASAEEDIEALIDNVLGGH